jgi:hypothetical protein
MNLILPAVKKMSKLAGSQAVCLSLSVPIVPMGGRYRDQEKLDIYTGTVI